MSLIKNEKAALGRLRVQQNVILLSNIFAPPNSSGTRTVCLKTLGKNSKGFEVIVQVKYDKLVYFNQYLVFTLKTVRDAHSV